MFPLWASLINKDLLATEEGNCPREPVFIIYTSDVTKKAMCFTSNLDFPKAGSFWVEKKMEIAKPKKEFQPEASVFTSLVFPSVGGLF